MLLPQPSSPLGSSILAWVYFVGSAVLIATLLNFAIEAPWFAFILAALVLGSFFPRFRARQQFRDMVLHGDVNQLLSTWEPSVDESEERSVGPLMRATALAAHGLAGRARQVLELARPGPAWDAAMEHRLFLEALLACCEDRSHEALRIAEQMNELPLPSSRWERGRAKTLRSATAAMARAFANSSSLRDTKWLRQAERQNPLLIWPMRYAEALTQARLGRRDRALVLLRMAPRWPRESAFSRLTQRLESELGA